MPWREMSAVDARVAFVEDYRQGVDTMTELCARHGISRETGYEWVRRVEAGGAAALQDRSRRPHTSPTQTPAAVRDALIAARQRHPTWGPKKLLARDWPLARRCACSTASGLLKDAGLVAPSRRRRRLTHPGAPAEATAEPNAVWTIDFKGQFRVDGAWCYPLTVVDHCTRYVLACHALRGGDLAGVQRVLRRVFATYGLPARVRSDNGAPFASHALSRLSTLAVWWIRLGIVPELIEPGCPQQNGRHERFHRTLKADTARPPAATWAAQQQRFRRYRVEFNEVRPHEALGLRPPAQVYVPSPRVYPATLPALTYPPDSRVCGVGASGSMTWRCRRVFVSHALEHQEIALRPLDEDLWAVYFGPVLLGHFDERRGSSDHISPVNGGREPAARARG